jgi:hypothetical protein
VSFLTRCRSRVTGMTAVAGVSRNDVWHAAARGLAEVRVVSESEVLAEAAANAGDVVIKSKDAEVVISCVEEVLGGVELVDQSHLGRRELTSLRTLTEVLWRQWVQLHKGGAQ